MLLSHQAGVPTIRARIPEGKFLDWEYMAAVIANEELRWEPGTGFGYHTVNYGWLVGEVVRRVAGTTVGTFFRQEVGDALGLDYWIGLPEEHLRRVTPLRPDPNEEVSKLLAADPDPESPMHLVWGNCGGFLEPNGWNTPAAYQAELCASGGIGNARAVARMYAPLALGGEFEGVRLVDPATIERMGAVRSALEVDATGRSPLRVTLGFLKVGTDYGLPESIFGHGGWGGSMGFADPAARLSFGYVMNQMSSTDRFGPLAMAAYRSLGYRHGKYGLWMR
jgi:CubicO group peptidase (beta-lactamase class C family)